MACRTFNDIILVIIYQSYNLMSEVNDPYYKVEAVMGRKMVNGTVNYLIKWEGYSIEDATWQKGHTLKSIKLLIDEYNNRLKREKQQQKGRKTKRTCVSSANLSQFDMVEGDADNRGNFNAGRRFTKMVDRSLNIFKPSKSNSQEQEQDHKMEQSLQKYMIPVQRQVQPLKTTENKKQQLKREKELFSQQKVIDLNSNNNTLNSLEPNLQTSEIKENLNNIFKPICIRSMTYRPKNKPEVSYQPINSYDNKMQNCIDVDILKKPEILSPTPSVNTTIEFVVRKEKYDFGSKMWKVSGKQKIGLKRINMLQKLDGSGLEYLIEEENGKLSILQGQEIARLYAFEMLKYFEKIVLKRCIV